MLSQNKSKASDWPTNQERPFKSGTIFTSKAYSSLSFEDREYFYSFYWPQRTWAEPLVEFYSKKFHPALKWAKNCFLALFWVPRGKYYSSLDFDGRNLKLVCIQSLRIRAKPLVRQFAFLYLVFLETAIQILRNFKNLKKITLNMFKSRWKYFFYDKWK